MRSVSTAWGSVFLGFALVTLSVCRVSGEEAALFRTDDAHDTLPWFQLRPAEFPPAGSAHYIAGELISLDHVNREGVLRLDRTDAQRRGDWDLPLAFTILPFGALSYHGARAELRDIPIGTHLHGYFYREPPADGQKPKTAAPPARISVEAPFSRCFLLEDDFSFCLRQQRSWQVESVDLEKNALTVTGITGDKPDAKTTILQIAATTRVWKGREIGALTDLAIGQSVLANLTISTLKGPGRCTSIWLDAESRAAATAHQTEVHRQFMREHGLPGWVVDVDHEQGIMSVVLFAGFDQKLLEDFVLNEPVTAAVAEESLRTWDQINDRKSGPLLSLETTTPSVGNSGVQVKCKPMLLLEGFRPKRVVRLWPSRWPVGDLPREEKLYQ